MNGALFPDRRFTHEQRERELQQTRDDISVLTLEELRLVRAKYTDMLAVTSDQFAIEVIRLRGELVHNAIENRESQPGGMASKFGLGFRRAFTHSPYHAKRLLTVPGFDSSWAKM